MKLSDRKESQVLSDLLPYLFYDDENHALWLRDGSAVRVLEIVPKNVLSATEDELESLRSGLSGVANQLPEGTIVQVLLSREQTSKENDDAANRWIREHSISDNEVPPSPPQTRLFETKLSAIDNQWNEKALFQTKIYASLRSLPSVKQGTMGKLGPLSFLSFGRNKKNIPLKTPSLVIQGLNESFHSMRLGLESRGFEVREPGFQEVAKIIFQYLNPERAQRPVTGIFSTAGCHDLSEALALTDLIEAKEGISLGRTPVKIGSIKTFPESSYPGLMTSLAGELQPFFFVMTIMVLSQTKERERLSRRQRLTTGLVKGNQVRNLTAENQLQDIEETLSSMIASGEKLFATSMHIVVHEEPTDQGNRFVQLMNSLEKIGSGCRWFEETVGAYPVFFGILPFAPTFITRPKRLLTTQLTDFLPFYGIGPGHDEAAVIFETPYQSLMGFSLFEKSPAGNGIVIGSTGSGKSTLVCGLLLGMIALTKLGVSS